MPRSTPPPTSLSFLGFAAKAVQNSGKVFVYLEGALMYKTKIDLTEKVRRNVIVILNDRLAYAIDLQSQIKQAHWNVKGPNFIALHELFDKISDVVLEQIDEIAERVTSLGGTAEGTVAVAAKRSKLKNYPLSITAGKDHLFYLSTQLSVYGKGVRAAVFDAFACKCASRTQRFLSISREIDKYLWFLEAHLQ